MGKYEKELEETKRNIQQSKAILKHLSKSQSHVFIMSELADLSLQGSKGDLSFTYAVSVVQSTAEGIGSTMTCHAWTYYLPTCGT